MVWYMIIMIFWFGGWVPCQFAYMKPLDVKKGNGLNSDVFRALKRPGKKTKNRISANNEVVAFFLVAMFAPARHFHVLFVFCFFWEVETAESSMNIQKISSYPPPYYPWIYFFCGHRCPWWTRRREAERDICLTTNVTNQPRRIQWNCWTKIWWMMNL